MFTGIVTDIGEIAKVEKIRDTRAKILCSYNICEVDLGASICCDGVCLTVTDYGMSENKNWFSVDISSETILKTKIGDEDFGWKPGRKVNLERSLKIGDELGIGVDIAVKASSKSPFLNFERYFEIAS